MPEKETTETPVEIVLLEFSLFSDEDKLEFGKLCTEILKMKNMPLLFSCKTVLEVTTEYGTE